AAELAGVQAKGADGRSLLPLLGASNSPWRTDFLIEHLDIGRVPTYCAVRNNRFLWVVYETGEKELYDLRTDPYEMENRASDPSLESTRREMQTRVGDLCRPPPPGMSPP
ncbi:MAG TPA: sulfatase/phosphatase domain-containing protein, partial [Actinomycetota bacterium]|nr:sulfatase/phosphatase domain-containing protein [Actinomycetota bacterium]